MFFPGGHHPGRVVYGVGCWRFLSRLVVADLQRAEFKEAQQPRIRGGTTERASFRFLHRNDRDRLGFFESDICAKTNGDGRRRLMGMIIGGCKRCPGLWLRLERVLAPAMALPATLRINPADGLRRVNDMFDNPKRTPSLNTGCSHTDQ
jgi:hypothetical protein